MDLDVSDLEIDYMGITDIIPDSSIKENSKSFIYQNDEDFIVSIGGMSFQFRSAFQNMEGVMKNVSKLLELFNDRVISIDISIDINNINSHLLLLAKTFSRKQAINVSKKNNKVSL